VSDELIDVVLDRASADESLSKSAELLVLAALEGPAQLADALAGPAAPQGSPGSASGGQVEGSAGAGEPGGDEGRPSPAVESARAYLSRITVTGFRGVGPTTSITLNPGPGLTVIAGRNGCGKSSFAEALEVALTRRSYRWSKRSAVWSESWRNLHQPEPASILVQLAEEGAGTTTVGAEWTTGAGLDDVTIWMQRPGCKRGGLQDLGWDRELELFRPFLSYDELGALFAEPSKLHDALAGILGLDRLEDATKLLAATAKEVGASAAEASTLSKQLLPLLTSSTDARAGQVAKLMRGRKPDLDAVSALVTGAAPVDAQLAQLRGLTTLTAPDVSVWRSARAEYDEAVKQHQEALAAAGTAALSSTSLLRAAADHYEQHGPGLCPVCGQGRLDEAWAQQTRASLDQAGLFSAAADEAAARVRSASQALTRAVPAVPPVLAQAQTTPIADVPTAAETATAWRDLLAMAGDPHSAAEAVREAHDRLASAVTALTAEADSAVAAREDAWQPLAVQVARWLDAARQAADAEQTVADVKAAHAWLKANTAQLRNDRLAPLAQRAKQIWAMLRQESNVDLGALSLEGSATRRRVELTASVDGQDAGAFGVMSQGELHALALALFLPRATAQDSPFGFIVIDDPVQAMDPAKVDGLAQVLHETAQQRQVIVLTHDDRLPEAVRRLRLPARILEVTRDAGSAVSIATGSDPTDRYLSDARAVASDKAVPPGVAALAVPELCRLALEQTCRDVYFRTELLKGRPRAEVEADWANALTTRARLALVVRGTPDASLDPWLTTSRRRVALGICTTAVHAGLKGNPHNAIDDVQATVQELAGHA
jgi:predicted ATPase